MRNRLGIIMGLVGLLLMGAAYSFFRTPQTETSPTPTTATVVNQTPSEVLLPPPRERAVETSPSDPRQETTTTVSDPPPRSGHRSLKTADQTSSVTEVPTLAPSSPPSSQTSVRSSPSSPPSSQASFNPEKSKKNSVLWFGLGFGVSHLSSSQTSGSVGALEFDRLSAPSLSANAGFYFAESAGLDFNWRRVEGEVKSSALLQVQDGRYENQWLSAELLLDHEGLALREDHLWRWRLGIQQQQLTFLVPLNDSVDVRESALTNIALGADYQYPFSGIKVLARIRYLHPASSTISGASLKYKPVGALDASFGAVHSFSNNWNWGLIWHGEWRKHDFLYRQADFTQDYDGTVQRFYNHIEARLGWGF